MYWQKYLVHLSAQPGIKLQVTAFHANGLTKHAMVSLMSSFFLCMKMCSISCNVLLAQTYLLYKHLDCIVLLIFFSCNIFQYCPCWGLWLFISMNWTSVCKVLLCTMPASHNRMSLYRWHFQISRLWRKKRRRRNWTISLNLYHLTHPPVNKDKKH